MEEKRKKDVHILFTNANMQNGAPENTHLIIWDGVEGVFRNHRYVNIQEKVETVLEELEKKGLNVKETYVLKENFENQYTQQNEKFLVKTPR